MELMGISCHIDTIVLHHIECHYVAIFSKFEVEVCHQCSVAFTHLHALSAPEQFAGVGHLLKHQTLIRLSHVGLTTQCVERLRLIVVKHCRLKTAKSFAITDCFAFKS